MEEASFAEQPHLLDPVTLLLQLADGETEAESQMQNSGRRPVLLAPGLGLLVWVTASQTGMKNQFFLFQPVSDQERL